MKRGLCPSLNNRLVMSLGDTGFTYALTMKLKDISLLENVYVTTLETDRHTKLTSKVIFFDGIDIAFLQPENTYIVGIPELSADFPPTYPALMNAVERLICSLIKLNVPRPFKISLGSSAPIEITVEINFNWQANHNRIVEAFQNFANNHKGRA